jgi:hypothetical protein
MVLVFRGSKDFTRWVKNEGLKQAALKKGGPRDFTAAQTGNKIPRRPETNPNCEVHLCYLRI